MRDPKRIPKILERLRKLWEAQPDLRLGQLIENVFHRDTYSYGEKHDWCIYYLEDKKFIEKIEKFYEEMK
jgi:uncharacterized protein YihD (DUF1040 family)